MSNSSKKEIWQAPINDYRSSGLTAGSWCQTHNLSASTLHYWITKLKKISHAQTEVRTSAFAKVDIAAMASFSLNGSATVTIRLGNLEISISDICHPELLSNLVSILSTYA